MLTDQPVGEDRQAPRLEDRMPQDVLRPVYED